MKSRDHPGHRSLISMNTLKYPGYMRTLDVKKQPVTTGGKN